eukprot:CAMPEP_0194311714 /NCGR_PEP_ID=MMETSP0171-20130528/8638_1 /TAXON_ID=218684 /ORGANISM="Corethron pennatum, Strain L29A3" /LENGTH=456 /DNA_ID=CAMNT_0039065891 /DNA_START=84 /DNA_END=1454 /DNA_ORIENTATION=+
MPHTKAFDRMAFQLKPMLVALSLFTLFGLLYGGNLLESIRSRMTVHLSFENTVKTAVATNEHQVEEHPISEPTNDSPEVGKPVGKPAVTVNDNNNKTVIYFNKENSNEVGGFYGTCNCPLVGVDIEDFGSLDWDSIGAVVMPTKHLSPKFRKDDYLDYEAIPSNVLKVLFWREGMEYLNKSEVDKHDAIMGTHIFDEILNPCHIPAHFETSEILSIANHSFWDRHMAVHISSHCHGRNKNNPYIEERNRFIEELQKHMEVQVHGSCATQKYSLSVPKERSGDKLKQFVSNFKFFIAVENIGTNGYVSEKLFLPLGSGAIPVYLGATEANKLPKLDGHSKWFINARDFESVETLANHLKELASNKTNFLEYLQWQDYAQSGGVYMPNAPNNFKECFDIKNQNPKETMNGHRGRFTRQRIVCQLCNADYRERIRQRKRIDPTREKLPSTWETPSTWER